jgi:hypothetical protein
MQRIEVDGVTEYELLQGKRDLLNLGTREGLCTGEEGALVTLVGKVHYRLTPSTTEAE